MNRKVSAGVIKVILNRRLPQIFRYPFFCLLLVVGLTVSVKANDGTNPIMPTSFAPVVEKVSPAVVTVRAERVIKPNGVDIPGDPMFRDFFRNLPSPGQRERVQRGMGSGVIVESSGTILTNNHVVEGATKVRIELQDRRIFTARIVGKDAPSDLAVLKIEAANLPVLPLGDSDKVRVGDMVLAIGNPLGLRQTVTNGIISAKGRQTGVSDGSFEDFLQTDAPINQGNSGGALVNLNGELIGINSQILSPSGGSIGIGFAIPSNMAKSVMTQLVRDGKVRRGMLGVGIQDVTGELAENFGLNEVRGVIINSVTPDGAAAKAGLKQGDVILSINGKNIVDGNELRNQVSSIAPGTEVTIGFLRDGKAQTAKAKLGELTNRNAERNRNDDSSANQEQGKLGVSLEPLNQQLARQFGIREATEGLVVVEVRAGSPADNAGINEGDVILQVNRQNVKTFDDVQNAIAKNTNKSVLLFINRAGQTIFVPVNVDKN